MQSESFNTLDRINDAIIVFDKKGKINYVNKAFAEVANYEPSNMIGKNIWELLPKLAESTVYKNVTEAIEKNKPMTFEWRGPYTNKIWETKVFLSFDGVTAIGRDITERKKAEEAIKLVNQKLTSIYESINAVFLSIDINWNFTYANVPSRRRVLLWAIVIAAVVGAIIGWWARDRRRDSPETRLRDATEELRERVRELTH
jgi:PAS domain S-box-containing protein